MDTPKEFFVFGLQKSGTKYFKKLIETNTNLKFKTKYVWKHTMNPVDFVGMYESKKSKGEKK